MPPVELPSPIIERLAATRLAHLEPADVDAVQAACQQLVKDILRGHQDQAKMAGADYSGPTYVRATIGGTLRLVYRDDKIVRYADDEGVELVMPVDHFDHLDHRATVFVEVSCGTELAVEQPAAEPKVFPKQGLAFRLNDEHHLKRPPVYTVARAVDNNGTVGVIYYDGVAGERYVNAEDITLLPVITSDS